LKVFNSFCCLIKVSEKYLFKDNELKGNALVDIDIATIRNILGSTAPIGRIKNFQAFVRKVRQKFEPEKLAQEEPITPVVARPLSESNSTTPAQASPATPALSKKWPFNFHYPIHLLVGKKDPILDKLAIPEMELKKGDFSRIVSTLIDEMMSYGDNL
jgi:hypothetical protein